MDEQTANQVKTDIHQESMIKFSESIDKMTSEGLTLIEAISEYCESNDIDPENIVDYINPAMKKDMMREATKKHLVHKSVRLKDVDEFFR